MSPPSPSLPFRSWDARARSEDRGRRPRVAVLALTGLLALQACAVGEETSREQVDFFENSIRPLLVDHCYDCHSVESGEAEAELLVDSKAAIRRGGVRGAAVVPGKPAQSLLMRAINYTDSKLQMPPDGKLKPAEIQLLERWIAIGAPDPRQESGSGVPAKSASPLERDPKSHWAFNPPVPADGVTAVEPGANDLIDAVASNRAGEIGLPVAQEASKTELIRRLYYDLTGLPPSHDDVVGFVRSASPSAYARLVDRLLARPEFGERFARHWMDVARYADTVGYALGGKSREHEGSYRYRDWAIRAFGSDMPYDEMLRHQLCGDRTDPENEQGNLDAMGFLTLGRKFLNPLDVIDDRIDVISRGLLGMTVTCARCHDHKFDPIPSSDYYALGGIIFSSEQPKEGPSPLMMVDKKNPVDSPVLIRGQIGNHGPIAPRQFLTALRRADEPRFTDGSGRWELAQRITASDNPLTARVMVNRIWDHLIGKPLVNSPSDFGFRTEPPAIPEVLDDLSAEFARHWSVKKIVRRIVLSRIYRQSAATDSRAVQLDPDNRYLGRANRKRRDFETLRDAAIFVAGSLDHAVGGVSVEITQDQLATRRTVYARIDRQNLPSLFRTFDFASPDAHTPRRLYTTVPQQALHLLNHRQMLELARRTAASVRSRFPAGSSEQVVTAMVRRVLSRDPTAGEMAAAITFLETPSAKPEPVVDLRSVWTYGTARLEGEKLAGFTPFTVFKDKRWQFEQAFPSTGVMGHAFLSKDSGHPANDPQIGVVRRFTAPFSGEVVVSGTLRHPSDQGDGVEIIVWIGAAKVASEQRQNNSRPLKPIRGDVEAGQTIDVVAFPRESPPHDSFFATIKIKLIGEREEGRTLQADSSQHFSGPVDFNADPPLDRLEQLAQALLMSNEFSFVD